MSIESIVDFSEATTAAERFTPAAEKILKGEPNQTVYNHYNSPCGQLNAGVWEGEVGQWKVNYTEHEYCEIVQGRGRCWRHAARSMWCSSRRLERYVTGFLSATKKPASLRAFL